MDDDPIKKLLLQSGLSYAEILKRLEAYKDQLPKNQESTNSAIQVDSSASGSDVGRTDNCNIRTVVEGKSAAIVCNGHSTDSSIQLNNIVSEESRSKEIKNDDVALKEETQNEESQLGITQIISKDAEKIQSLTESDASLLTSVGIQDEDLKLVSIEVNNTEVVKIVQNKKPVEAQSCSDIQSGCVTDLSKVAYKHSNEVIQNKEDEEPPVVHSDTKQGITKQSCSNKIKEDIINKVLEPETIIEDNKDKIIPERTCSEKEVGDKTSGDAIKNDAKQEIIEQLCSNEDKEDFVKELKTEAAQGTIIKNNQDNEEDTDPKANIAENITRIYDLAREPLEKAEENIEVIGDANICTAENKEELPVKQNVTDNTISCIAVDITSKPEFVEDKELEFSKITKQNKDNDKLDSSNSNIEISLNNEEAVRKNEEFSEKIILEGNIESRKGIIDNSINYLCVNKTNVHKNAKEDEIEFLEKIIPEHMRSKKENDHNASNYAVEKDIKQEITKQSCSNKDRKDVINAPQPSQETITEDNKDNEEEDLKTTCSSENITSNDSFAREPLEKAEEITQVIDGTRICTTGNGEELLGKQNVTNNTISCIAVDTRSKPERVEKKEQESAAISNQNTDSEKIDNSASIENNLNNHQVEDLINHVDVNATNEHKNVKENESEFIEKDIPEHMCSEKEVGDEASNDAIKNDTKQEITEQLCNNTDKEDVVKEPEAETSQETIIKNNKDNEVLDSKSDCTAEEITSKNNLTRESIEKVEETVQDIDGVSICTIENNEELVEKQGVSDTISCIVSDTTNKHEFVEEKEQQSSETLTQSTDNTQVVSNNSCNYNIENNLNSHEVIRNNKEFSSTLILEGNIGSQKESTDNRYNYIDTSTTNEHKNVEENETKLLDTIIPYHVCSEKELDNASDDVKNTAEKIIATQEREANSLKQIIYEDMDKEKVNANNKHNVVQEQGSKYSENPISEDVGSEKVVINDTPNDASESTLNKHDIAQEEEVESVDQGVVEDRGSENQVIKDLINDIIGNITNEHVASSQKPVQQDMYTEKCTSDSSDCSTRSIVNDHGEEEVQPSAKINLKQIENCNVDATITNEPAFEKEDNEEISVENVISKPDVHEKDANYFDKIFAKNDKCSGKSLDDDTNKPIVIKNSQAKSTCKLLLERLLNSERESMDDTSSDSMENITEEVLQKKQVGSSEQTESSDGEITDSTTNDSIDIGILKKVAQNKETTKVILDQNINDNSEVAVNANYKYNQIQPKEIEFGKETLDESTNYIVETTTKDHQVVEEKEPENSSIENITNKIEIVEQYSEKLNLEEDRNSKKEDADILTINTIENTATQQDLVQEQQHEEFSESIVVKQETNGEKDLSTNVTCNMKISENITHKMTQEKETRCSEKVEQNMDDEQEVIADIPTVIANEFDIRKEAEQVISTDGKGGITDYEIANCPLNTTKQDQSLNKVVIHQFNSQTEEEVNQEKNDIGDASGTINIPDIQDDCSQNLKSNNTTHNSSPLESASDVNLVKSKKHDQVKKLSKSSIYTAQRIVLKKYKKFRNQKSIKRENINFISAGKENIRDRLKEQLELLRTRKASSPIKPLPSIQFTKRTPNRLNSITSILMQKLNTTAMQDLPKDDSDISEKKISPFGSKENRSATEIKKKDVVLSNETEIMIVDVVGGYTSPSHEPKYDDKLSYELTENNSNDSISDAITPTKTTDVTKIKGWKNKKFSVIGKKPSDRILQQLTMHNKELDSTTSTCNDTTPTKDSSPPPLKVDEPQESDRGKSAFISDELDQYLTENSQLKISYEIPKLEAEQHCATNYTDVKFPDKPQSKSEEQELKEKEYHYKPKTLAEKRKLLLGQATLLENIVNDVEYSENNNYKKVVSDLHNKLIKSDTPFTRKCFVASTNITNTYNYIDYNGKMLKVPSDTNEQVIAKIREKRQYKTYLQKIRQGLIKQPRYRKPSLLNDLKNDIKNLNEWDNVKVKLPKLYLEIRPEIGKRIDPKIEHLIQNESFELAPNRIELALSTLKTKKSKLNSKIFVYPIPFENNQKFVTMKRRIVRKESEIQSPKMDEGEQNINEIVNDVMNKMLNYIDISEETKDIIQDESDSEDRNKADAFKDVYTFDKSCKKKRKIVYSQKGIHKTTLEMKRLSCKIVSISVDEEKQETKPCEKDHCRLGCVCSSLQCTSASLLANHCGQERCMFQCRCKTKTGNEKRVSLPVGVDIFSEGVLNRLRDEAKKNLAKVEKEFTQTVIRTNNQIIVVGDSPERRRRATRVPKKYCDYVEEDPIDHTFIPKYFETDINTGNIDILEEPAIDEKVYSSAVKLMKYDFSRIIPFCMVHNLYKCHCKNQAEFESISVSRNPEVFNEKMKICKYLNPPPYTSKFKKFKYKRRPYNKEFNKEKYCCRTRGLVTPYYIQRNKTQLQLAKIRKSTKLLEKKLEVYLRENADKIREDAEDMPDLSPQQMDQVLKTPVIVLDDSDHNNPERVSSKASRNREQKIQRRKARKSTLNSSNPVASPNLQSDLFGVLGKKYSSLCSLEWQTLQTNYTKGAMQVWYCNTVRSSPLVVTEKGKRPSPQHYDIKLFEQLSSLTPLPSDMITWLSRKQNPLSRKPEDVVLLLGRNKDYWEICGLCEKSGQKDNSNLTLIKNFNVDKSDDITNVQFKIVSKDASTKPSDPKSNTPSTPTPSPSPTPTPKSTSASTPVPPLVPASTSTTPMVEGKKLMFCNKRRFQPKKLVSDEPPDTSTQIRRVLWVPIPSIASTSKWRLISMTEDFAYLSLSRCSYTIKYEDVMRAIKMAETEKVTIVLKSEELQKHYAHRDFGIYCVHNYSNKIFVGPYYAHENHDINTLSFVNEVLVDTNLFNQTIKKKFPGNGTWFRQENAGDNGNDGDVVIIPNTAPVVDLTYESEDESKSNKDSPSDQPKLPSVSPPRDEDTVKTEKALDTLLKKGQLNINKTLLHLKKESDKSDSKPTEKAKEAGKLKSSANSSKPDKVKRDSRYLITNVPGLGYIAAYQCKDGVDVVCPITKRIKRFSTSAEAIAALERVFSNKFIKVPSTFKLEFKMHEKLDKDVLPLDRSTLHGYCIVGEFGVRNVLQCSASELNNLGLNKNQIMKLWNMFEQKLLLPAATQLSKLLNTPMKSTLDDSLPDILDMAMKAILQLKDSNAAYIKEKIELETRKVDLAEQCSKLCVHLPPDKRAEIRKKLNEVVNGAKPTAKAKPSEPMEVVDLIDDDTPPPPKKKMAAVVPSPPTNSVSPKPGIPITMRSLLSGKKVTTIHRPQRSLLTVKTPLEDTKYVVVQPTSSSSTNPIVTTTAELSNYNFNFKTFKINEKSTNEKLANENQKVNEQPTAVVKPVIKLPVTTIGTGIFLKNTSKPIPTLVPGTSLVSVNNITPTTNITVKLAASHLPASVVSSCVSTTRSPVVTTTCISTTRPVPDLIKATPVVSSVPTVTSTATSMATLTPVVNKSSLVLRSKTSLTPPSYIAIKENEGFKYFQLVSDGRTTLKRPATVQLTQPIVKKTVPSILQLSKSNTDKN